MIRTHWMLSAAAAKAYVRAADYYAASPGLWFGQEAARLGLTGQSTFEQFDALADNRHPVTGEILRPHAREDGRIGLDMTFNSTKSVGIARELAGPRNAGDPRIEEAHIEAVKYTLQFVEADMQCRIRTGGRDDRLRDNRATGNMVAHLQTHRDTRINADDQRPDMSLHTHAFIFNLTRDPVENKLKAAEIARIKHDAPFYEAIYHNRLAHNLKDLGYGIRKKDKAFEIEGISDDLAKKFSRRRQYIKAVAEKLGITSPEGMSKLGATTRLGKTKELADDLNGYYVSRLTELERQQLADLEGQPSYESNDFQAVRYAIGHLFERRSVVDERRLYETAIRQGIGSVTPEGIQEEAELQGVLTKNGEATTRSVLEEEGRIIAFAAEGRGTMRPLGGDISHTTDRQRFAVNGDGISESATLLHEAQAASDSRLDSPPSNLAHGYGQSDSQALGSHTRLNQRGPAAAAVSDGATLSREQQAVSIGTAVSAGSSHAHDKNVVSILSPEQAALVRHVWNSPDQVILLRGAAGTGKTTAMKTAITGIDKPVAVLAPSAEASRGVLRAAGFKSADTIAAFLGDQNWQERIRGGVIWVDEAGLLPIRDLGRLVDIAQKQDARIVLQGDPKQHRAVSRDGNMFHVLQQYAGLPVAELKDIRRQKGQYKALVAAIDKGDLLKAHDLLNDLGYIRKTPVWDHNKPLVDDFMQATNAGKEVLVVAPTHKEGDEITAEIRKRLKEEGKIGDEERAFAQLRSLAWTEAEKADLSRYQGGEVLQYHRNSGSFKAGDRVGVAGWQPGLRIGNPAHFAVYAPGELGLAAGDHVRVTANGWDRTRTHRLNNGARYVVSGFTEEGDIALSNGWVIPKDFGHLAHGYVATSFGGQGKTVDVVLGAMGTESRPAINTAQFYVTASRGRERFTLYTDLSTHQLREAIKKQDTRKSATEVFAKKPGRLRRFIERVVDISRQLREKAERGIDRVRQKEVAYER